MFSETGDGFWGHSISHAARLTWNLTFRSPPAPPPPTPPLPPSPRTPREGRSVARRLRAAPRPAQSWSASRSARRGFAARDFTSLEVGETNACRRIFVVFGCCWWLCAGSSFLPDVVRCLIF